MRFLAFALLLLAWPGAAVADMRATWRSVHDGSRWIVETADNGDARLDQDGQPYYLLRSGGEIHIVYTFLDPPRVVRIRDLEQVMRERGVEYRLPPSLLQQGRLVERGEATIAGRRGRALYLRFDDGQLSPRPMIVVSRDPAFAPIGRMLTAQLDFSIAVVRLSGNEPPANFLVARRFIGEGMPLLLAGYSLERIDEGTVDALRFRLPGAPMTLDDLRNRTLEVIGGPRPPQ